MTTAEILGITSGLVVLFLALWVGIPMWMIFRYPDRDPRETRTVPAYLRHRAPPGMPAQRRVPAREAAEWHELVSEFHSR